MAQQWIKPVEGADLEDGKLYFLARRPTSPEPHFQHYDYYGEALNGKRAFYSKPGLALRYKRSEELRQLLIQKPELVCVEVPADADTRWKARKKRYR